MSNLLLENVEYKVVKTSLGTWRRYLYPSGQSFAEYKSDLTWFGLPFLHYTYGKCPETGKRVVAKGVVAVGRLAMGILAIGQASFGLIALGQLAIGILLGLGQGATGVFSVGQMALGAYLAVGQFAAGWIAIGQLAAGKYVLAQMGLGTHVWSMKSSDPLARDFFKCLLQ
jgi:hypothetical protein